MKVFIVPALHAKEDISDRFTARDIIDFLAEQGQEVYVSAPEEMFKQGIACECARPAGPLFALKNAPRSPEEELYNAGTASRKYLRSDTEKIVSALKKYQPDVILDLGRVSALIAARLTGIPVVSLVSGNMFRSRNFDSKALRGVNETLSSYKFEQVFRVTDLYAYADSLFTLGPASLDPFAEEERLVRIGYLPYLPETGSKTDKVFILFNKLPMSAGRLNTLLSDTFKGAPYPIEIWYPGCDIGRDQNLHYTSTLRISRLSEARAVIHDGSEFIFRQSTLRAIPQVIVHDGSWNTSRNAASLSRSGFGTSVPAEDLSVQTLYEGYRRILASDSYRTNAGILREEVIRMGGGEVLLDLLSRTRK